MKIAFRQARWVLVLAVALVSCGAWTLAAAPQSERGLEKGKGHQNQLPYTAATKPNYDQGFRDGQDDRRNNRPHVYRERLDPRNNDPAQNRAYEAGYDAGFNSISGGQRPDDSRDRGRIGGYGQYQPNYDQGYRDGQDDRANNRPHIYRERRDPRNNDPNQNRAYEAGYDEGFRAGAGQSNRPYDPGDRGRIGGQYGQYQPNYDQGFRDGREDRANNQRHIYRERRDPRNTDLNQNRAYEAGYDAGYGPYDRDRDRDRGQYGGQYGNSVAARNGWQDGLFDGQKDRRTGHSNRPTQGDWYKSATRGYDSSQGDKQAYKNAYREAYVKAYERGYTGQQ